MQQAAALVFQPTCTLAAAAADVHVLAGLPWSSVVVDRRQRSRSAAGKAQAALQELSPGAHRVVLSPHGLSTGPSGPDQLFTLLSFLKPGAYETLADVVPHHIADAEQQVRAGWLIAQGRGAGAAAVVCGVPATLGGS
jgi:hypothetical protein